MAWKHGEQALKSSQLEEFAEAALDAAAGKIDFDRIDPEAIKANEAAVKAVLVTAVETAGQKFKISGTSLDRDAFVDQLYRETASVGPIAPFVVDSSVTEIMANGPGRIFVERNGKLEETHRQFRSADHLLHVIRLIGAQIARSVDDETPFLDARLPDGSRVHAIIPPMAPDGPLLTIRKFSKGISSFPELVKHGVFSEDVATFLKLCVKGRLNIIISGSTNSGKTTLLNALATSIDDQERVITIEDACELQLMKRNVARLEARAADLNGKGEVSTRILLKNALRMRPDRIVVGEIRGVEAFDMLQAMNTGHQGSMTTVHANSPRDALLRIESLTLLSDIGLPLNAVRRQLASAIQLLIHLERRPDGTRRMVQVTEIVGMEGEVITTQDLFAMKEEKGGAGTLVATGLVPKFESLLERRGVSVPRSLFSSAEKAR